MKPRFPGFPPEARKFLKQLKRNNNREWFMSRKGVYEERVKAPMTDLVLGLGEAMRGFAPELAADPKKAIYRIYRDVYQQRRFSKDSGSAKTRVPTRPGLRRPSLLEDMRNTPARAPIST